MTGIALMSSPRCLPAGTGSRFDDCIPDTVSNDGIPDTMYRVVRGAVARVVAVVRSPGNPLVRSRSGIRQRSSGGGPAIEPGQNIPG